MEGPFQAELGPLDPPGHQDKVSRGAMDTPDTQEKRGRQSWATQELWGKGAPLAPLAYPAHQGALGSLEEL